MLKDLRIKGEILVGKIKLLDDRTIQKIAAGEVIEKPASIVKELIENSLDANSMSIVVEIKNGGKSYIRITDDGDGITDEDILLAFERHSTSKLREVDDLYNLSTLGFRGEALSSIAAVSKVEVLTKTKDSMAGINALVEDGEIKSMDKVGTPKGTTMIIKDLFYNLPVRKNFLKSDLTESNKISDMVNKLAIGNYNTSFKLIKDNKIALKTNGGSDIKENIYSVLGKDITKGLNPINYSLGNIEIKGLISNNTLYRSNRSHQYLYINGRYIVNYALTNVIEQFYKTLIPVNRYPVFIIYINMDPNEIDVNIHPTKQEVKFTGKTDIYGLLGKIVKDGIYKAVNVPKFKVGEEKKPKDNLKELYKISDKMPEITSDFKKSDIIYKDYSDIDLISESSDSVLDTDEKKEIWYDKISFNDDLSPDSFEPFDMFNDPIENIEKNSEYEDELGNLKYLAGVFNTYVIAENRQLNKIYFIDQHAAHERIMYEKFKNEYETETIHTQQLIAPEVIDLTNSEFNNFIENKEVFLALGFDVEEFGINSVAVRGVPFLFGKPSVKTLFMDLLDNIENDIKSNYDTKLDKLMKLACTSAIKGGDRMTELEINSLLKDLSKCENPLTCPHGRPTLIEVTKKDLEKQFLRII